MTKQSEAAKTYFIGLDPGYEQRRNPTMGSWTKEFRTKLIAG